MNKIAYLCDGRACEHCVIHETGCKHTYNIDHAKNFQYISSNDKGEDMYEEVPNKLLDDVKLAMELAPSKSMTAIPLACGMVSFNSDVINDDCDYSVEETYSKDGKVKSVSIYFHEE